MRWIFLFFGPLCVPSNALARDSALNLGVSGGYACAAEARRYHGVSAAADVRYAFADLWAVSTLIGHSMHNNKGESFQVSRLSTGILFQLDVLEYIPWFELAPTAYVTTGEQDSAQSAYGLAFGFGIDWLLTPEWSLGVEGHYHQIEGSERFPAYVTATTRLGYRFVLGDPFAP